MGKYDKEREELGLGKSGSTSSVSTTTSKYAAERERVTNPAKAKVDDQSAYVEGMKNSRMMEVSSLKTKQAEDKATKTVMKDLGIDLAGNVKRFGEFKSGIDKKAVELKAVEDARPTYLERVRGTVETFPEIARPFVAPFAAIEEIPFSRAVRQITMPEKNADEPRVGGLAALAAGIAVPLTVPGAGLGGGALYKQAGNMLQRYAPNLGNNLIGKAANEAIKQTSTGAILGPATTLALNPQASKKELAESTAYGAGGGFVLGGVGRLGGELIKKGIQSGVNTVGSKLLDNVLGAKNALNEVSGENLPQTVRRTVSIDAVPEVFPERFRRTVGGTAEAIPTPTVELPGQQLAANTARIASDPRPLRTTINERGNIATQRAGNLSDEFNQGLNARDNSYERITNIESVAKANENVKNLSDAEANFLNPKTNFSAEHVATGNRLLQELDRLSQIEKDPIMKDTLIKRALNVSEKLATDLTTAGQTAQAASILKRLSPEGQLMYLQRTAANAGKKVPEVDADIYRNLARDVQAGSTTGKETSDFLDVLAKLKAGQEVTPDEMLKATAILEDAKKFIKSGKQSPERLPKEMKDVRTRDKVVSFLDEMEQSALARIKARRSQVNALPLGEWADHAFVAASQIAKGTIRTATYVEDMVRLFGEEVKPYAKAIYTEARKLLNSSSKNISEGNVKEASEAFERLRSSQTPAGKVAEKFIKESEIKQGDVEKLRDLAKQLNDLKGKNAQEADMHMQAILNKYQKASWWDRIQAIRYIAMLFNTGTQLVNAASGPIMASLGYAADIGGALIDMGISKAMNKPRTTTLYGSNPLKFTARWIQNAVVGGKAGARGVNPSGIAGANDIRGLTFKELSPLKPIRSTLGLLERGLGAVAKGADYATYRAVYQSEMDKIAYLDAKNSGVQGRQNIKNHIEKFLLDPPEEAIERADRIGKNTTFQRSDSLGGQAANAINSGGPKVQRYVKPVVQTIFPFLRTPINIASTALDLTPVGMIKGVFRLINSADDMSRREAIRTLGLGITGTAGIGSLGYYLSSVGIITGANDSGDKDVDAIREQAGKGKYRFNISGMKRYMNSMMSGKGFEAAEKAAQYQEGDKQFDYNKLQPVAFPLAAGAALQERRARGETGVGQALGTATDAAGSLLGMSTLKGLQDVFQPSYGGTQGEKSIGIITRLTESFLKSFSPSLLAQEARRQDPVMRKTPFNDGIEADVKGYFKSRTPGLSQSLPANKTTLGLNKMNAPGITGQYLNPYKSDIAPFTEAAQYISRLIDSTGIERLAPSAPEKKVSGINRSGVQEEITIPQKRYEKLQEDVGAEIMKQIKAIPKDMSDEQQADRVLKIYEVVRKIEMNKVKMELGIRPSR